jgi:asparagine synthase (glutamine-hydrolysing)
MFDYLAVVWSEHDREQNARALDLLAAISARSSLSRVFLHGGLAVFFDNRSNHAGRALTFADGRTVVLGHIFRKATAASGTAVERIEESSSEALSATEGQWLVRNYWGRYVAFSVDPRRRDVVVVPDPTGECPCYVHTYRGLTLLAGCASTAASLQLMDFTINWDYVTARLLAPSRLPRDTGLLQVEQLRSGEALRIDASGARKFSRCWDLFDLAAKHPIESFDTAVDHARHAVQTCVDAWASRYPRIVHMLSGGLDSSIVLACLLRSPSRPDVTCLNVYDPMLGGDERRFARLACESLRSLDGRVSPLLERPRELEPVQLDALARIRLSACPTGYLPNATYRHIHQQSVGAFGAVLSTGLGGDYIFYRTSSSRPAIDYVHDHGVGRDFFRIVRESTGQRTYWAVAWEALKVGALGRKFTAPQVSLDARLVHPDVVASHRAHDTGTEDAQPAPRVAPNKHRQIEALYRPVRKHDPFEDADRLHWIAPLLSQPIMESFARMPVYLLKAGGIDRAIARRAFADVLPRALMERRSKGVTNNFIHAVFRRHQEHFRCLLLEGELARRGLLNRPQVESYFSASQDGFADGFSALLGNCLDVELWLQRWARHHGQSDRADRQAPISARAVSQGA